MFELNQVFNQVFKIYLLDNLLFDKTTLPSGALFSLLKVEDIILEFLQRNKLEKCK